MVQVSAREAENQRNLLKSSTMPTLRRRNSDPGSGGATPLRSSLAHAAWAVEDRVVWGAADVFRGLVDIVKRPFQRIAWAVEHWLVWPIQEETALWSRPVRAAALAGIVLLAGAGVAAGIISSNPSTNDGGTASQAVRVSAPVSAPPAVTTAPSKAAVATSGPVLHGSTPDFVPESGGGVPAADAASESSASTAGSSTVAGTQTSSTDSSAAGGSGSDVAGPAAIKVAREFAGAFVLYETGRSSPKVRTVLHATTTKDLAQALLKRPPRLPANVNVPKAKVLNIVAGPRHGDTYSLSVSLLRVGVTSELRVEMSKSKKDGWQVTDVLG
jgi:hypothetical protein